jgi:hypothetical protein
MDVLYELVGGPMDGGTIAIAAGADRRRPGGPWAHVAVRTKTADVAVYDYDRTAGAFRFVR